jgi:hypothetical protein
VYDTSTCPPAVLDRIACNDEGPEGCAPGSAVRISVTGGSSYLVRLGGINGSEPIGDITFSDIFPDCNFNLVPDDEDIAMGVSEDCQPNGIPDECDGGCVGLLGSIPPTGSIDARQATETDGTGNYGIDTVVLQFSSDASAIVPSNISVTSTTGTAPGVNAVLANVNDLTVFLDGPIPAGGWTTITYVPTGESICIGYRSSDVDASGIGGADDITAWISHADGDTPLPVWSVDIDGNGAVEPDDLLREIDMLNGGGSYAITFGLPIIGVCP